MKKLDLAIIKEKYLKKQYLTLVLLFFLLLILPLLLILVKKRVEIRPKAIFGTVDLALFPASSTYKINQEFEVQVLILQPEAVTPTPTSAVGTPTPTITPGGPTRTPTPTITPGGPTLTPTPTITPGGPTLTPTPTSAAVTPTPTPTSGQPTATPTSPQPTPTPTSTSQPTSTPTPTVSDCAAACQAQSLPGGTCKSNSQIDDDDVCIGDTLAFGCTHSPNYNCCCEGNICQAACQQLGHTGGACKTSYNPLLSACESSETNIGPLSCNQQYGQTCCCSGDGSTPPNDCASYCQANFLQGGTCKHEWEIEVGDPCTAGSQYGCGGRYCCCQKPTCLSACQQMGYSQGACMSTLPPQTCLGLFIGSATCDNAFDNCCCTNEPTATPSPVAQRFLKVAYAQAPSQPYKISAVDLTLSFDKNILEVKDVSITGTPFTDLVLKEIKNDQGIAHFSAISKKPTDQLPSGPVIPIAKITFKGKAAGTSAVNFTQHQIIGFNEQNEDVTLGVGLKTEGSYTIISETGREPKINFAIKFRGMQGIGNTYPDLKLPRVRVVDENKVEEPRTDFKDIEVVADNQKVYRPKDWITLTGITAGPNYTLLVKGPKHLQKRMAKRIELFAGEDTKNNFNWSDEKKHLDPGDLPPQDGVCNAHDASRLLERFGSTKEEDVAIADLNYDGIVNMHDYSLLLQTLKEKYEDEE